MLKYAFVIPVIQFGFGWWFNVSTFVSLLVLLSLRHRHKMFLSLLSPILLTSVFLMYISYIWQDFGDLHSFLRVSRECLIIVLLALFIQSFGQKYSFYIENQFHRAIMVISFFQLIIVIIQFVSVRQGVWIGPDPSWFAGRGNVIPDLLDLRYSNIRPAGTFSEPSYLGLISISCMIISGFSKNLWRNNSKIFYVNLLVVVFSQSKSALLFASILLLIYLKRNSSKDINYFRGVVFPLILIGVVSSAGLILQTLLSGKGSVSIENRIYKPLEMVFTFVVSNPLGASFYDRIDGFADSNSGITWEEISHNSLFNLIFSYGLVGFLLIFYIMRLAGGDFILLIFLFAALIQNGSFLDFDKLFLVYFTITMYRFKLVEAFLEGEGGGRAR